MSRIENKYSYNVFNDSHHLKMIKVFFKMFQKCQISHQEFTPTWLSNTEWHTKIFLDMFV